AVVAPGRAAGLTQAAAPVDGFLAQEQLLPRHRPVGRRAFGDVAPTAAGEVPHTIAGVHRLDPVLPLPGVPAVAALTLPAVLPRIGHARHARGPPRAR